MSLKAKLISTISAFVLILTIVIVGVWAATQANIAIGGTVNFQATNVYAKVTGTVTGMDSNPTLPTLIFSEGENASSEEDIEKWSNLDLLFNSSATPIEISVTVENLSTERWLLVDIIEGLDNGKSDNINKEVKKENSDYTLGETHTLVPSTGDGTSKVEFTITLTVDNSNYSADTIYSYIINLNNSNEAPPEPAKELEFTFDGNKVTGYTGSEANITIPTSYSMERTPYNSFVLTEEELSGQPSSETLNKMGMLYALKNYTIYPNGQTEGILCENGFKDFMSLTENLTDPAIFPLRVELPEDLTFELTEEEFEAENPDQYTTFKKAALEFLQNFYVKFGNEPEEICLNYDDYRAKLNEKMPEGPKPEYFPLKFRIDYASYKYVEGDDYQVEVIGESVFENCISLTSVSLPSTLISIGDSAFNGCSNLTSIQIPEGVTSIGESVFENCISLTSVFLPSTLTSIGDSAFYNCSSLTPITIPKGVTSISRYAFWRCSSLTSASLPSTLTSIGQGAFDSCSSLTSITIPEGVTSIGSDAFWRCSNLTSVSLPSTLTSIGNSAFSDCLALAIVYNNSSLEITKGESGHGWVAYCAKEVVANGQQAQGRIEESGNVNYYINETTGEYIALAPSISRDLVTQIIIAAGAKEINQYAFRDCSNLTSVSLPSTLDSIGDFAFDDCSSLTSITIPKGVTSIGSYAFYFCRGLTSITLPSTLTSIGAGAFHGCSGLTSITIPEGVTSIGNNAFDSCSSLTSITLPNTLTSISEEAFTSCSSLTEITINGNISTFGARVFSGCPNLTKLTLGAGVTSIPITLFIDNNLRNLTEIVVLGDLRSETFPRGTWVKNGGSTVTSFSGAGTYTRTDI